ncbi:MAG TPA: MOSC N-terminal beta barrel domain-containing protein [Phenylobacterium sp.]|uniref:MOSC domain-containing protein n=1 Tax=Phenylobacterium sp. TaxID=1871053 RepID=UPI002CA4801E|nr:MOSC N-terminal beta barrel domain-containing protein [Phenylobacterium sp.]HSV03716.1 MOSC N-terminal beta barrel domain-containing protein [Phenylobacterium sp.]
MSGLLAGIFRHPVKGFTPEPLTSVELAPGQGFPFDRIYAVENGPSGFDERAPAFVPKQKFTVLASLPKVAAVRTRYHGASGDLEASAPGAPPFFGQLTAPAGRAAFAHWLAGILGEDAPGPLKVIASPESWRFTDHPLGQVSVINLASIADLSRRMGAELDPLRFRANLYVDGWPAWAEHGWTGRKLMLGWAEAEVFKPIVRCAATEVNPATAERDQDIPKALFEAFGDMHCGVYVRVTRPGRASLGDACTAPQEEPAALS